jgi:cytochrome c553
LVLALPVVLPLTAQDFKKGGIRMKLALTIIICTTFLTLASQGSAGEMTGEYLVKQVLYCNGCHGKNLGGRDRKFGGPGREAYGRNITPHQTLGIGKWSKDQIMVALRQCKRPDGSTIGSPMPCEFYRKTPDIWLEKAIAYITNTKSVPPVAKKMPTSKYKKPEPTFPPMTTRVPVPDRSNLKVFGEALANAAHCMECHEVGKNAKPHRFGRVAAVPMKDLAKTHSKSQLISVLKSNKRLEGTPLKGPMRGRLRGLANEDYDALWAFISSY